MKITQSSNTVFAYSEFKEFFFNKNLIFLFFLKIVYKTRKFVTLKHTRMQMVQKLLFAWLSVVIPQIKRNVDERKVSIPPISYSENAFQMFRKTQNYQKSRHFDLHVPTSCIWWMFCKEIRIHRLTFDRNLYRARGKLMRKNGQRWKMKFRWVEIKFL